MIAEAVMCLALNLYHEARGEPREGQLAVAHVVLNRVKNPSYPDNICDVVYQGKMGTNENTKVKAKSRFCQFSWTCDGKKRKIRNVEKFNRLYDLAEKVIAGETKDPTRGALFFHTPAVNPKWADERKKVRQIGQHVFYR
jgi:N-acetylmuramoyl-L-alanine amidase